MKRKRFDIKLDSLKRERNVKDQKCIYRYRKEEMILDELRRDTLSSLSKFVANLTSKTMLGDKGGTLALLECKEQVTE